MLCVIKFPEPYTQLSYIALWAVITTDLLYEANIGLSISKGFNRVLGTLAAGFIGFGLNQLGPEFGPVYPYFVVNYAITYSFYDSSGLRCLCSDNSACVNQRPEMDYSCRGLNEVSCGCGAGFLCNNGRWRF